MFSVFDALRKRLIQVLFFLVAISVAACDPIGFEGPSINTSKPVPVALLVPGGSENAGDVVLATSLENAARLAIADLDGVNIDLRVYHTAGQSDLAADMARKAVNDGAKIILGPVFAESANAAGLAVAGRNVNVLAFSNNTAVAGGNVFLLGSTFQNTADRLASYAARQGKGNILIAHGQDGAEVVGRDAIARAINKSGGNLAGTTSFEVSQNGVIDAVPQIVSDVRSSGAQSVFLTSGTAGALPFLAQLLPENGLDPAQTQYIGLQRWDIPTSALSLPGLQGGWFAQPDPVLANNFQNRYFAAYGDSPHPIAGLAYDGIAAIGALVAQGQSDALTRSALTQSSGFIGVGGVFRLLPDGTNERGLAVAQIQDNQVIVIDPAPRSFGATGF
ncbi:MAG: penicillin-binding protein activator [Marinosulfonomonas sp.]|nr:penicillin-binding protein activator [Marinosulfonomonas sp.]